MRIILLRHYESKKNKENRFSSPQVNSEYGLSDDGVSTARSDAALLAKNATDRSKFIAYYSNSKRSEETAYILFESNEIETKVLDGIVSSNSGAAQGLTLEETKKDHNEYFEDLDLYRAGCLSVYDFRRMNGRENKKSYEKKVVNMIKKVIDGNQDKEVIFLVMHHSSITAAVIHFCREFMNYPRDFYGYIKSELGKSYVINLEQKKIELCDADFMKIIEYIE